MAEKKMTVLEERIVRAIYATMEGGADIARLSVELGVGKASARRYAKLLIDSRVAVRKESKRKIKLVMSAFDCFALFKVEKDFVGITVCSFAKKYIHSVVVPYNEALIPSHTVTNCYYVLKRICDELGAERTFVGTIICEKTCVERSLCEKFASNIVLEASECEQLAMKREKERARAFTEYFCNSVRKARLRDRIIDSWKSMDVAERGMIEALLCYVAEKIHRGEII